MKILLFLSLVLVIVFSLLLSSCGETAPVTTTSTTTSPSTQVTTSSPAPTATGENKYGGVFRQALNAGLTTPIGYPAEATPDSALAAVPALESLIRAKTDGTILPVLATAWKLADDKKSIVITLRQGVKFHDGSDFDAEVCKWNLDLEITAQRAVDWLSIDIVDDYTIRINIAEYKNTTLSSLAGTVTQQISKATFDKEGIEYSRWHPVGTGPFIFVEYERDAKLTYKKNPDYWDKGLPYLDGLEYSVITDSTVRKLAFQKGDLHKLTASALEAQELQKEGFSVATSPGGTFVLIPCSTVADSPWSKLKVRQAASYALNREALAKALGFGFVNVAYQVYPGDKMAAIPNLVKTEYNPEKARQLLAEAGYPDGFTTMLHSWVYIVPADWINAVAAQLSDVGIMVTTDFPEVGKYMSDATNGWSDGLMGGAFVNGPGNPNTILDMYLRGFYYSSMERSDTVLSALAASMASEKPDSKLIQAIIQAINDDMMVIPFLEQVNTVIYHNGIHDEASADYGTEAFIPSLAWLEPSQR